ncbi:MAG: methyltransferase domain-containing protein [Chloroflexi bacterium]|nr:MAG: methyltransferase domain-containing protein [Chloroflexota bacterium]
MTGTVDSSFDRLAEPYDRGMAPLERLWLRQMRAAMMPHATGRVLEIGVGTGANLPFYHAPAVAGLAAVDESAEMLAAAARRAGALSQPAARLGRMRVDLAQMDVEGLAFGDGTFDTVVGSLVLCSVFDQQRALAEIRRVLARPGGRLLLMEHMRPRVRPLAWLADAANLPWVAVNGRCHLNRQTQEVVTGAGFCLERVDSHLGGLFRLLVAQAQA